MKNIEYINAGAGSGKTYRLTHKLADHLTTTDKNLKVEPSEVIVTTFSRAAAAEIKSRARQVLLENGLIKQASQLDTAAIDTIHGVAKMFLEKYWYAIGSTPNQAVINDIEKNIYRNQSICQLLDSERYTKEKEAITTYFYEYRPKIKENNKPKSDPDFWVKDLEALINKLSYYNVEDIDESLQESLALAPDEVTKDCIEALFHLAKVWINDYKQYKRAAGVIDYDDMEKGFLELLYIDSIAEEIGKSYKLVMVDEFQDCNPIQLRIFDRLSEIISQHSTLPQSSVWVGDPNQAIYGFRGSDSDLINRVAKRFPKELRKADKDGLMRDTLETSYRSRGTLVDLANSLFAREGYFDNMTKLGCDRDGKEDHSALKNAVEHWHFANGAGRGNAQYFDGLARKVKDLVESGTYNIIPKGETTPRPIQYKDIAILTRSNDNAADIAHYLRLEGIPTSSPETSFLDRAEIQLLLSLLYLCEGYNAHEIASVMHIYGGWSTEKILANRLRYIEQNPKVDGEEYVDNWLVDEPVFEPVWTAISHAKGKNMSDKVTTLIIELGLKDKVKLWGDAEIRKQNLITFESVAKEFTTHCARLNLFPIATTFSSFLKEIKPDIAKDIESDTLKVFTYHSSKGLEWPMVILASLANGLSKDLWSSSYFGVHEVAKECKKSDLIRPYYVRYLPSGSGPIFDSNYDKDAITATPFFLNAVDHAKQEMMRLLYVGLTRARDYLVVTTNDVISKMNWLNELHIGVKEICADQTTIEPTIPSKPTAPTKPGENSRKATIEKWEHYQNEILPAYNAIVDAEMAYQAERTAPKPCKIRDLEPLHDLDLKPKYCLPSKLKRDENIKAEIEMITLNENLVPIGTCTTEEGEEVRIRFSHAKFGTCVHNAFAACQSTGEEPSESQRTAYVKTVERIIKNYSLTNVLPEPSAIADSLYELYNWLRNEYGPAEAILHEYPFSFPYGEGQIMKGEIDLIWRTAEGDVIIDFKNYMDQPEALLDESSEFYVGKHYVPQLLAYRNIVEKAGRKVIGTILYYDIIKRIVRVK